MVLADLCHIILLLMLLLFPQRGCPLQDDHHPSSTQVKVGVILDSSVLEGKIADSCLRMAAEDFYSNRSRSHSSQLVFHVRDYQRGDVIGAASAAIDLLENVGVQAIIGTLAPSEVELATALGGKTDIPIISFTETSPSPFRSDSPYFIRTGQSELYQVEAIVDIVKAYNWREAVLISEDSEFGKGMIASLTDALEEADIKVPSRSLLANHCSDGSMKEELYRLMTMQTRVFVVHMTPPLGTRLFSFALELEMMSDGYAWLVTTGMGNLLDSLHPSQFNSLQGVLGVKTYIPETKELGDFMVRWKRRFRVEYPELDIPRYVSISGLWAYDSMWALASALEKTEASRHLDISYPFGSSSNSTTITVSPTGPQLLERILKSKFRGLSGEFELKDGQRTYNTFQMVNVIGRGEKVVGLWSPTTVRLSKALDKQVLGGKDGSYSRLSKNLKMVVWPGDTPKVPWGWAVPTSGKKLKVVVPVNDKRSREYVDVVNLEQGETTARGYSIDIFEAALELLPYSVPYEYVPFIFEAHQTYNSFLHQVSLGEFDVAVADITILANRSEYVDFTFPYTESGLSLLVPVKDEDRYSAFVFLKPFTTGLWLTTAAFFLLIAVVVWLLEHRRNPEFRGQPPHHIGLAFYFAFSTLVFAHRERLTSNSARTVVIVWSFVVLILTSSYTASLSSILTVQKLQPKVKDIQTLIRKGEYVGYQKGAFVLGILKQLNFDESKLRPFTNVEDYVPALSAGSKNGGVAAVIDETPYLKMFLAKYCQGFTMIGPIYKTGGFGFALTKGSPLLSDLSLAMLTVTEGDRMTKFEKAWFGNQTCLDSNTKVACKVLSLSSFWGLFIITGTVSFGALSAFLFSIFTDSRRRIRRADATGIAQIWKGTMNFKKNTTDAPRSSANAVDHRIDGSETMLIVLAETPCSIPRNTEEVRGEDDTSGNKQAAACN